MSATHKQAAHILHLMGLADHSVHSGGTLGGRGMSMLPELRQMHAPPGHRSATSGCPIEKSKLLHASTA